MSAVQQKVKSWRQTTWGEMLAEFFGTFILILFGDGVVGLVVAGMYGSGRADEIFASGGDWMIVGWGWGLAVAFGVYVAGGISGAHLNPAVTFGHAIKGLVSWSKVIPYWIAQTAGAFLGAVVVYIDYVDSINMFNADNGVERAGEGGIDTFSIFATFPAEAAGGNWFTPFFDQVVGTFLLVFLIYALLDSRNSFAQLKGMFAFMVGLIVVAVGISFGTDAGYAINPARDFGPRLFAWFAGWGPNAFPGPGAGGYWWIPIIGPLVGGGIAPFAYKYIIEKTLKANAEDDSESEE